MPELHEVQTIVRDLKRKIIGRRIAAFWSDTPRIFRHTTIAKIKKEIPGLKIKEISRLGKNILIYLSHKPYATGNKLLVIHPKLTGRLLVLKSEKLNVKKDFIRAIFYLDKNLALAFSDVRKFGKIMFGDQEKIENLPDLKNLGPDALNSLTVDEFKSLISSEKRKVKQVLLDQEIISGLGNIYSDEALWQAKIHPFTPSNQLTNRQLTNLYSSIKKVLQKSLALRGSSMRDYRDTVGKEGGYFKTRLVYGRENLPCFRCKTKIQRTKIGVRSAHFCPKCQKSNKS